MRPQRPGVGRPPLPRADPAFARTRRPSRLEHGPNGRRILPEALGEAASGTPAAAASPPVQRSRPVLADRGGRAAGETTGLPGRASRPARAPGPGRRLYASGGSGSGRRRPGRGAPARRARGMPFGTWQWSPGRARAGLARQRVQPLPSSVGQAAATGGRVLRRGGRGRPPRRCSPSRGWRTRWPTEPAGRVPGRARIAP